MRINELTTYTLEVSPLCIGSSSVEDGHLSSTVGILRNVNISPDFWTHSLFNFVVEFFYQSCVKYTEIQDIPVLKINGVKDRTKSVANCLPSLTRFWWWSASYTVPWSCFDTPRLGRECCKDFNYLRNLNFSTFVALLFRAPFGNPRKILKWQKIHIMKPMYKNACFRANCGWPCLLPDKSYTFTRKKHGIKDLIKKIS